MCCQTLVRAGGKPDRQTVGRQFPFAGPIVGRISPGMHPLSINAAANAVLSFATRLHNIGQFGDICHPFLTRSFRFELPLKDIFLQRVPYFPGKTGISSGAPETSGRAVASVFRTVLPLNLRPLF